MTFRQPGGAPSSLGWLLLAIGILLSIEGLLWIVSPQILLRLLLRERAASFSSPLIRVFGATPLVIGVAAVILVLVSPQGRAM